MQEGDQDEGWKRDRTGETSGRTDIMECPAQNAKSRAAREVGEVDELFSKLKKKVKAKLSEPPKVCGCICALPSAHPGISIPDTESMSRNVPLCSRRRRTRRLLGRKGKWLATRMTYSGKGLAGHPGPV